MTPAKGNPPLLDEAEHTATLAALADAEASLTAAQAQAAQDSATIADLTAKLEAAKPAPAPAPDPWTVDHQFDLTRDEGWAYTTGVRNTDQSYNRKTQAAFGPGGLTITAERGTSTATIYSADMWSTFATLGPGDCALEADITLTGLGSGMFPSLWGGRSSYGSSELDIFEYCGKYVGAKYEMKHNLMKTSADSSQGYNQGQNPQDIPKSLFDGGSFEGKHTWRVEKVGTAITLYVDGHKAYQNTKAIWDAAVGAGSWDAQVANARWLPRLSFQVGNGTSSTAAGPIPSTWRKSTLTVSRLVTFKPTSA